MTSRVHPPQSATELDPEDMSVGSLNAFEVSPDEIRVAFRISDEHFEIGQLAILRIYMPTAAVAVEYLADSFFMGFHSVPDMRDLLVETGKTVRRRTASEWQATRLGGAFLRDAFALQTEVDFVFGDDGTLFRKVGTGEWSQEQTGTKERILALHGPDEERVFAAGGNGLLIQSVSRGEWRPIDLALGSDLRCLLVEKDRVIVAGNAGLAGILQDDEFRIIETGLSGDILSVARFRDQVYFCDSEWGLHVLRGETLEGVANLGYAYRLNSGPRWLTIAAGQNFFQFDGKTWRGVEVSYRDGYRATPLDMSVLDE